MDKSVFIVKYNDTGTGLYKDNTNKEILASTQRTLVTDIGDSVVWNSDFPLRFFGLYAFPGGAFPTATYKGTLYVASADHGVPGDPDYVTAGTRFISLIDGADEYDEFTYF